ncbi:MAG: tetratricopeptide repeat protein, partial [Planctomycetota bacterium]
AEFLRQRGRTHEAGRAADRAEQAAGGVQNKVEAVRVGQVVASCRLAAGDIDRARQGLALVPKEHPQPYLEACVHYAVGDLAAALAGFRVAGGTADSGATALGQAACLIRQGQLQEAHDLLLRTYEQDPWLRHRAAAGLALAFLRCNQLEPALLWVDRALEADPTDPYAHYLRGRVLRLSGQSGPAAEALTEALRLRDDFVHAIAEMAAVQSGRVTGLVDARRYADRAVDLVPTPSIELCELQGMHAFAAGGGKAASEAFARARDLADDAGKWWGKGAIAVVDYSRGLVDDAANALMRMEQDLGKDDPLAKWAKATREAIDDHAQKESLGDSFDRGEPGATWNGDSDGPLGARVNDGQLLFRGKFSRQGGKVQIERVGGARRGKNFLAASTTLQLGKTHGKLEDFVGLGLEIQKGNGGVECQVRVGLREGKAWLKVLDGRENGQDVVEQLGLTVPGFDASARHSVEIRVLPSGDPQNRKLVLQVSWNGQLAHRRELKTLTGNTNTELKVVLFAEGQKGGDVDVAFDDFRLERRKDTK